MSGYAFFYLGSLLLFAILSSRLLSARNVDRKLRNLFTLVYLVGMVMGAHALYYAFCEHTLVNQSLVKTYDKLWEGRDDLCSISGLLAASARLREATVLQGGFWGGPWFAITALLPFILFLRLDLRTKRVLLDVFAVSFPFALAFAKIGCIFAGCCHGIEGTGPLFLKFTWVAEGSGCYMKRCFPTQFLDLALYLAIGIATSVLYRKGRGGGTLVLWFVLFYAVGRFLSEFTRGDDVGGKLLGLSPVQVILIASLVPSVMLLRCRQWFDAILTWRTGNVEGPTDNVLAPETDGYPVGRLDRWVSVFSIVVLLACVLVFPSILLLLLVVPLLVRLRQCLKARNDPAQWTRLHNLFTYLTIDVLFIAAYFVPNLTFFYAAFAACTALSILILGRFYANAPQSV